MPLEEARARGTGLLRPLSRPLVLRPQFLLARTTWLKLLFANPDIVSTAARMGMVDRGAGAALYRDGGRDLYFGQAHPPIYDLAAALAAGWTDSTPDVPHLAIGDGLLTDVQGGMGENLGHAVHRGRAGADRDGTVDRPTAALWRRS